MEKNQSFLCEKSPQRGVCLRTQGPWNPISWSHDSCRANVDGVLPLVIATLWISTISTCLYYSLRSWMTLRILFTRNVDPKVGTQVPDSVSCKTCCFGSGGLFRCQIPSLRRKHTYLLPVDLLMCCIIDCFSFDFDFQTSYHYYSLHAHGVFMFVLA